MQYSKTKNQSVLFSLSGVIFRHLGRGEQLGYPTANIHVSEDTPEGIFVGFATIDELKYPALVFVGRPLTFHESDKKAEIYILDFKKDIYGKTITAEILKKLRDNMKFESKEELIMQMKEDEKQAREYFEHVNQLTR